MAYGRVRQSTQLSRLDASLVRKADRRLFPHGAIFPHPNVNSFTREGISPFIRFVRGRGKLQPIFGQTTPEQFILILDASGGHFIGNLSLLAEFVAGIQFCTSWPWAVRFRQRTRER